MAMNEDWGKFVMSYVETGCSCHQQGHYEGIR